MISNREKIVSSIILIILMSMLVFSVSKKIIDIIDYYKEKINQSQRIVK
jgi:hypothetical protein